MQSFNCCRSARRCLLWAAVCHMGDGADRHPMGSAGASSDRRANYHQNMYKPHPLALLRRRRWLHWTEVQSSDGAAKRVRLTCSILLCSGARDAYCCPSRSSCLTCCLANSGCCTATTAKSAEKFQESASSFESIRFDSPVCGHVA